MFILNDPLPYSLDLAAPSAGKLPALNAAQDLGVKVATPVGTLVGQLLFGWLADVVGRKRMCTSLISSPSPLHASNFFLLS